ncbi:MAG: phage baseplate assembly protein V, partial [Tepidiformaceae bacterium]
HTFEGDGRYRTTFTVGGYGPDTTADLLLDGASRIEQHAGGVTRGLTVGIVTDSKDPEGRGRVKVKFPWLADAVSHWVRVAAPMAGPKRGFFFLPEVDDEVLIGFEHGDFNRPYIIGSLWNGKDEPPIPQGEAVDAKGAVVKRVLKTRAGHIIRLDDTSGSEKIEVIDKSGKNLVVIDTAANRITVEAQAEVEITAKRKISLSAPEVEIKGDQSVTIKAAQIESAASGSQKISGGIVEIN